VFYCLALIVSMFLSLLRRVCSNFNGCFLNSPTRAVNIDPLELLPLVFYFLARSLAQQLCDVCAKRVIFRAKAPYSETIIFFCKVLVIAAKPMSD